MHDQRLRLPFSAFFPLENASKPSTIARIIGAIQHQETTSFLNGEELNKTNHSEAVKIIADVLFDAVLIRSCDVCSTLAQPYFICRENSANTHLLSLSSTISASINACFLLSDHFHYLSSSYTISRPSALVCYMMESALADISSSCFTDWLYFSSLLRFDNKNVSPDLPSQRHSRAFLSFCDEKRSLISWSSLKDGAT